MKQPCKILIIIGLCIAAYCIWQIGFNMGVAYGKTKTEKATDQVSLKLSDGKIIISELDSIVGSKWYSIIDEENPFVNPDTIIVEITDYKNGWIAYEIFNMIKYDDVESFKRFWKPMQ